ncbi:MAG: histidinol phosphate phosphatase domain-containing protein [Chloroflexi bacterium]|nr:histidinol phosphate phosphatase domain-containing protein [Chloroflexota bacterium]
MTQRIDLHTHTFYSDGALLPSEHLRRFAALDHAAVAITDHADASNLAELIERLQRLLRSQAGDWPLTALIGVELTHVAPASIDKLAWQAKTLGAELVIVHGETIVEPVAPGTNRAAVESPAVDLLAHPGLLTLEEAEVAAARGCYIEITTRKGHSLTNGHVAKICRQANAPLVVNTDTHEPGDMANMTLARAVALGAGLSAEEADIALLYNPQQLVERILAGRAGMQNV